MSKKECLDPYVLNMWHVVSPLEQLEDGDVRVTRLLGTEIEFGKNSDGYFAIRARLDSGDRLLPIQSRYGYLWTNLGNPEIPLFDIPEYEEADRKNLHVITVGIQASAPRVIENFLDMAHFPFVHTGILGAEPHTEIKEYNVDINERDEVIATECRIFQPVAAASSTRAADIDYIYRIPHPYSAILYKTSGEDSSKFDVIGLFVQPESEETVQANMMCSLIDSTSSIKQVRSFQQIILAQDKPILENQFPKRLPLDPRAETPIRADKTAIVYRRWLRDKGMTYGVIPAVS